MAPSPENDNAPKAPDKSDKTKVESITTNSQDLEVTNSGSDNKEASVSTLNDVQLKALLDEAINYKTPKDREGKSVLFQNLLDKAEDDDRKARATSASGSESVRYFNSTARRVRRRRKHNSISENMTHGGSLNNLAKEELFAATNYIPKLTKPVSTRERQGGSLPCNVNTGITHDKQFFEEACKKKEIKKDYTAIDMESESLLEHDHLSQNYTEQSDMEVTKHDPPSNNQKYTSRFNLEIGSAVDDPLNVRALERTADRITENDSTFKQLENITATSQHYQSSQYSLVMPSLTGPLWTFSKKSMEDNKKMDENGNALAVAAAAAAAAASHTNSLDSKKNKKKKIQTDKNVVVLEAKDVAGHRSDIINDLDKLVEYIRGDEEQSGTKSKSSVHKTKFHKHNFSGDDKTSNHKKQRTRTKGKTEKIQKSNSMEEISVSKLDDFNFIQEGDTGKVPLRSTKSNADRPRERRSWGNSESLPLHASAENLETADFRVVTKKKKSKKRRSSVSSRRQPYLHDNQDGEFNRIRSPEPRRKSACSAPHSDKSNDSSDIDSVHSLPIDTDHINIDNAENLNLPVSYADIAKTSNTLDRPKPTKQANERKKEKDKCTDKAPTPVPDIIESPVKPEPIVKSKSQNTQTSPKLQNCVPAEKAHLPHPEPFVQNIQNWPAIQHNNFKNNNQNNSHKSFHNKNCAMNYNIKNNLRNVHQHKHDKIMHQQSCITNMNKCNNLLPNNVHVETAVQLLQTVNNIQVLPQNIPDVQTIEKMHFKQLQAMHQHHKTNPVFSHHSIPDIISNHITHIPHTVSTGYIHGYNNNTPIDRSRIQCAPTNDVQTIMTTTVVPPSNICDSDRTSSRPAVVILSGENKEVSGLTFGFDVNVQLLSDDVCNSFTTRFRVPDIFKHHNHDKIVNFIGLAWEEIMNQPNGKVKYFSENL